MSAEGGVGLPCCNYIEAVYDHDPEGPCEGTMTPGWPEYVCNTCRAHCGALAHPEHASPPAPTTPTATDEGAHGEGL